MEIIFRTNKKTISLNCKIAKSFKDKMKGLMDFDSLNEDEGMIFCFSIPWFRSFWMKNVKIPLDIIFINRKYEIINICEANVENGFFHKLYRSRGFCKYVIECNKGFCRKHGINKGDKIKLKK